MSRTHTDPAARSGLVLYAFPQDYDDYEAEAVPYDSERLGIYTWDNLDPAKAYSIVEQLGDAPNISDAAIPCQGVFPVDLAAAIAAISEQTAGSGSETYIRTFTNTAGEPVAGVACYLTSDAAGGVRITGKQFTNSLGQVAFNLDPGTYYMWATHSHVTFPQPITITVADV